MYSLIIPCGGKSSRFPNMKPKWLLTHPDGRLMVEKAISGLDLDKFERIVFSIIKEHDSLYSVQKVLNQVFQQYPTSLQAKFEICVLENFTSSASETVYLTLKKQNIQGSFVIKDSDNYLSFPIPDDQINGIVCCGIDDFGGISNIPGKSFILTNEENIVLNIVEKKIISDTICLGGYFFKDAEEFIECFESINFDKNTKEMYISHMISYLIAQKRDVFFALPATAYEDWGTLAEWKAVQEKMSTYFCDFDGVLIKNSGKYGDLNWDNNDLMIEENCEHLRKLLKEGAQLVITTARPEEYREKILCLLRKQDIHPVAVITGLNHAPRYLINDFAPTNPFPSARALSIPRNGRLSDYLTK